MGGRTSVKIYHRPNLRTVLLILPYLSLMPKSYADHIPTHGAGAVHFDLNPAGGFYQPLVPGFTAGCGSFADAGLSPPPGFLGEACKFNDNLDSLFTFHWEVHIANLSPTSFTTDIDFIWPLPDEVRFQARLTLAPGETALFDAHVDDSNPDTGPWIWFVAFDSFPVGFGIDTSVTEGSP